MEIEMREWPRNDGHQLHFRLCRNLGLLVVLAAGRQACSAVAKGFLHDDG